MQLLHTHSDPIENIYAVRDGWVVTTDGCIQLWVPRDMCQVEPRVGEMLRTATRGFHAWSKMGTVFVLVIENRVYRWDDYPEEKDR